MRRNSEVAAQRVGPKVICDTARSDRPLPTLKKADLRTFVRVVKGTPAVVLIVGPVLSEEIIFRKDKKG